MRWTVGSDLDMELQHRWMEDIDHVHRGHAERRRIALALLGLCAACAVAFIVHLAVFEGGLGFLVFDIGGDGSTAILFLKLLFFIGAIMFLIFGFLMLSLSKAFAVWMDMPLDGDSDEHWTHTQAAVEVMFKEREITFKKMIQKNPNIVGYFKLPEGLSMLMTRREMYSKEGKVHLITIGLRNINPGNADKAREVQGLLDGMPYLEVLHKEINREIYKDPQFGQH